MIRLKREPELPCVLFSGPPAADRGYADSFNDPAGDLASPEPWAAAHVWGMTAGALAGRIFEEATR